MQRKDEKTKYLIKTAGKLFRSLREELTAKSLDKLAREYDIDSGNLSKIENGKNDPKLTTLWKIAEALEIPLSELIKRLENELPDGWHIGDV